MEEEPRVSPPSDDPHTPEERPQPEQPPELVDPVNARDQSAGDRRDDLLPMAFVQGRDALRNPSPEEVLAAVSNLVRGGAARDVVRALLRDYGERYREVLDRADELQERLLREQREGLERLTREQLAAQERLGREQQEHAVTKERLQHAGTRTAGQTLLQILGGGFLGWGLSVIDTSWSGAAYIGIALVMITLGCLPVLTIPWWRGGGNG
jgi:hypothetical protein